MKSEVFNKMVRDELERLLKDHNMTENYTLELLESTNKLAKEKKIELDRESKATYVHPQKIINELTKISKNSNPRYREKVEFNKRNNLDYKGRPKK